MKRLVLPSDLQTARPKHLRSLISQQPGKLNQHARRAMLLLGRTWNRFSNRSYGMEVLVSPARVQEKATEKGLRTDYYGGFINQPA